MGRKLGNYVLSGRRSQEESPGTEVKAGRDLRTNQSVTVKIFDIGTFAHAAGARELIKFEVGTMYRTNIHPNIVQLVDVLASKSKIFVVMERVRGGDLFDAIVAEGRLGDENLVRHYFRQLLDAIEHCHSRGICHRDIKPENVLLDKKGRIKLTGFALAGLFDPCMGDHHANLLHATCGTPDYIAPEVIQGVGYNGRPVDFWSAGVTLYTMLAGFLPFEADSVEGKFARIQASDFKRPPGISMSACSLLEGMLEPNPRKRFRIADVRSHPWLAQRAPDGGSPIAAARTANSFDGGHKCISPPSSTSSLCSSVCDDGADAGGGDGEGAVWPPKCDPSTWRNQDEDEKADVVGEGGDVSGLVADMGSGRYGSNNRGSSNGGSGSGGHWLTPSSGRSGRNDSISSLDTSNSEERGARNSSNASSSANFSSHGNSQPRSVSPSPPTSPSVLPSAGRYLLSNRRTDSCRSPSPPLSSFATSPPPASSVSSSSLMPPVRTGILLAPRARTCTWAEMMSQGGVREKEDTACMSPSSTRSQWWQDDQKSSSTRQPHDRLFHSTVFRDSSPENHVKNERRRAGEESIAVISIAEESLMRHGEVTFGEGAKVETQDVGVPTQKGAVDGEDCKTPKTERNTPGSEWSFADRVGRTPRSFFSGNSLSPPRRERHSPLPAERQRQQTKEATTEKRPRTWPADRNSVAFTRNQALSTSPRARSATGKCTRIAVSPAPTTATTPVSSRQENTRAVRGAALVHLSNLQIGATATAAAHSSSSPGDPSKSVMSNVISRPALPLNEMRMAMHRLGATRLLLSLPESEPLILAKTFQCALEDCGCVCRLLPNPKQTARARVKACRTIVTKSRPRPGEEAIVGIVFSVLCPGVASLPTADGFGAAQCREGSSVMDIGIGSGGRNGGYYGSASGWDSGRTDVLVALSRGTTGAFDCLLEDLLDLKDPRWRATVPL